MSFGEVYLATLLASATWFFVTALFTIFVSVFMKIQEGDK